jgi:hypothetical protein
MDAWDHAKVLAFCIAHSGQPVTLRQRGTTLRVAGRMATLVDRDACSMDLVEAEVDVSVPGLHCALTLHESTVLLHLSGGAAAAGVFLPVSIPYADLVLEGASPAKAAAETQAAAQPEARSPYELL